MNNCSNINLWNLLQGVKTEEGQWTVDNPLYPLPANYNDSINICNIDSSSSVIYTYIINEDGKEVSSNLRLNFSSTGNVERVNNNCIQNYSLGLLTDSRNSITIEDSFTAICPFRAASYDNNTSLSSLYINIDPNTAKDLWYSFIIPPGQASTTLNIVANGQSFNSQGTGDMWMLLYDVTDINSACNEDYSNRVTPIVSNSFTSVIQNQLVDIEYTLQDSSIEKRYLLRIGVFEGEGRYNLELNLS